MVLGFHGCDKQVGEAVLAGSTLHLEASSNPTDWLGGGIYFWENDPRRAMEWAIDAVDKPHLSKGKIEDPFVVGAIIDLGFCLNLLARECLAEVGAAYKFLLEVASTGQTPMPENKGTQGAMRFLDKAVIESLHKGRVDTSRAPYDTVRAAFKEGDKIYPDAGFEEKNHIQIAVRNPACIKGYFRPFVD